MKNFDFAYLVLTYNLFIGLLLIVASDRLGVLASVVLRFRRQRVARLSQLACQTFGVCLAVISLTVLFISRFTN